MEIRNIFTHHDGHGLNEKLYLSARDIHNGVAYDYSIIYDGRDGTMPTLAGRVAYQRGPHGPNCEHPGVTELAVLAIVEDRLSCHQEGPFACEENKVALQHIRAAMRIMKERADRRANHGTLNTMAPEKKEQ